MLCLRIHSLHWIIDECLKSKCKGCLTSLMLLDFRKTFNSVNHEIFMTKRTHYTICGQIMSLIESFSFNRKQYVVVDGNRSALLPIKIGSILAPTLFLVYINDLLLPACFFYFICICWGYSFFDSGLWQKTVCNNDSNIINSWCMEKMAINIKKSYFFSPTIRIVMAFLFKSIIWFYRDFRVQKFLGLRLMILSHGMITYFSSVIR